MGQSNTHYDQLPTGEHSVLPVDGHSYQPKALEYSLLITESTADTELIISQRHNLQAIYPLVAKFYNDGYTLNQLKRIPCVKYDNKTLFQVVLSRPVGAGKPNANEKWQLHVKRSFVTTEHSNSTITTHVTELWRDIQEEACHGARLVSIEPTIPAAHHQVQEVDVFFNLPPRASRSFYIYQAISVPVIWQRDAQHATENALECNWFENFTTFLSEGWKLVEILFDSSVRHRVTVPSRTLTMNSVWVFEKQAEFENVSSPKWEGVIVRYLHKSITRFEDFRECNAKTSWDKVIHTMGSRGWELACIVSTPPSIQKGSMVTSIHCKVLMFFQRPFTGNKPLRRQSSSSQGITLSPIRLEGVPDWSIIGESRMEGGRPVCLPSYSERGVDVGPLESSPDRPQTAPQVPPEPPPTYAETVANDVTLLFNTSMTEASPPLSPTQMTVPAQLLSSSLSPGLLPPSQTPVSQMPSGSGNHDVFFDATTSVTSTTEASSSLASQAATQSASSETPGRSNGTHAAPRDPHQGTRDATQTSVPHSNVDSGLVSRTNASDRTEPSGTRSRPPQVSEAVSITSSQNRPGPSGSRSRPPGGSKEPRQSRDARGRSPSGSRTDQQQRRQQPKQQVRAASADTRNTPREPRESPRTRDTAPSRSPAKQQRAKDAQRSVSRERKPSGATKVRRPVSSYHIQQHEARAKPPPKPPRASKNVPKGHKDASSSVPHQARPSQGSSGERRPDGSHHRIPVAQTPTTVATTTTARSIENWIPREAIVTQQSHATSVRVPAPLPRMGGASHVSSDERDGNKKSGHRKPVAQPSRDAVVASAAADTHRRPTESTVIQKGPVADAETPVPLPRKHGDGNGQASTGGTEGNQGLTHRMEPKPITQTQAKNPIDSTGPSAMERPAKPTVNHETEEMNQVPKPLPRNINDRADKSSSVNSRGEHEIPHGRNTVDETPKTGTHSAESSRHLRAAELPIFHKPQPPDSQVPVPLPRKNTAPEAQRHHEVSRRIYNASQAKPVTESSKAVVVTSTKIPRKLAEPTTLQESQANDRRAPPPRPPKTYVNAKGSGTGPTNVNAKGSGTGATNLLTTAAISYNRQDLSEGYIESSQREGQPKQGTGEVEYQGVGTLEQGDPRLIIPPLKRASPLREWNSDHLSSLDRLQREWEDEKSRANRRDMTEDTATRYNKSKTASHSQGVNSSSRGGLSAAERLHVTSVRPPVALERLDTNQSKKELASYRGQSWKRDVPFDPSLVQKRRDRDYERVDGRAKENANLQVRSKDDLNVAHSNLMKEMDNTRTVRAKLTEITNVSPSVSDASDEPPQVPPRRKRSGQGSVGMNKPLMSGQPQQRGADYRKELREAAGKTLNGMDQRRRHVKEASPVERPIPTYNQALERRTQIKQGGVKIEANSQDQQQPSGPVDHSRPQELPDVVRHKQEGGGDSFWLIQDTDTDEVFISSHVMPESQPKMRASPHSERNSHQEFGDSNRRQDLQKMRSSECRFSPTRPERGNRGDEPGLGLRIELSEADRRSLDSLQSFIVDQQKRPPEYDDVLARRLVAPKPMKQTQRTAPDIIENSSRISHMSQVANYHHDVRNKHWSTHHHSGQQRKNTKNSRSKPPLPSYQQVVGPRPGAILKLKVTDGHQSASGSITHRRAGDQRYHSTNGRNYPDQGPQGVTDRVQEELGGPRNNKETEDLQGRQPRPLHSQSHAAHTSGPLYPRDDSSPRLSDSPVGSMDSFDLISQWSQDEVEPPPTRLTKDLRGKREAGQLSSGGSTDREFGDYALLNQPGKPGQYESTNQTGHGGDLVGQKYREASTWSPEVSRKRDMEQAGDNGTREVNRSVSQDQYIPPQSQRLTQRHVYSSKEIL